MSLASHIDKLNAEWRKSLNPAVDEDSAATIMKQILLALQHCHECGVVHRNLQPENIIYDNSTWKLTGFHHAAPINSDSEQADLKSVGVLLTRLLTDERKMPETNFLSIMRSSNCGLIMPNLPSAYITLISMR